MMISNSLRAGRVRAKSTLNIAIAMFSILLSVLGQAEDLRVMTFGDSLTAGLQRAPSGVIRCIPLGNIVLLSSQQDLCKGNGQDGVGGFQPELKTRLNAAVLNYGNSSEATATMEARLSRDLSASQPTIVLLLAGTNDVIRSVPNATSLASIQRMVNTIVSQGRVAVVGTIPPLAGSRFSNRTASLLAFNEGIRNIQGAEVADIYTALASNWPAYTSGDFIHIGNNGYSVVAQTWIDALPSKNATAAALIPVLNLLLDSGP